MRVTFSLSLIHTNSKIFSIILNHSSVIVGSIVPSNTEGFLFINLSNVGFNLGATGRRGGCSGYACYYGCGVASGTSCAIVGSAIFSWRVKNLCIIVSNISLCLQRSSFSLILGFSACL